MIPIVGLIPFSLGFLLWMIGLSDSGQAWCKQLVFQSIANRCECGSIAITSDRAFLYWTKILNEDIIIAYATTDRLVLQGSLVQTKGGRSLVD